MLDIWAVKQDLPYSRGLSHTQAIELVKDARYIRDFDGEIPGATRKECGNYLYHDLAQAKKDVCNYWTF